MLNERDTAHGRPALLRLLLLLVKVFLVLHRTRLPPQIVIELK